MKEVREYKQLKSQLNTMLGDLSALKIEVANKQREYELKNQAVKSLKEAMEKIDSLGKIENLRVSEHAIVRYFERVKGYDIEEIQKEILSHSVVELISKLGGTGSYPNDEGYSVVMKNFTVTTII